MAGDLETTWWQWLREEADHWWMPLGGAALLLAAERHGAKLALQELAGAAEHHPADVLAPRVVEGLCRRRDSNAGL